MWLITFPIIFFCIPSSSGHEKADDALAFNLKFFNKSGKRIIANGTIVGSNQVLFPRREDVDIIELIEYPQDSSRFLNLINGTQLVRHAILYELDPPPSFASKHIRRIYRYPICVDKAVLKIVNQKSLKSFKPLKDESCEKEIPNYDRRHHVCKKEEGEKPAALIIKVEENSYLAGFQAHIKGNETIAGNYSMYNLFTPKCENVPFFEEENTTEAVMKLSQSLGNISQPGVILAGNFEANNSSKTFLPLGLATVIDKNHAIISEEVVESIKNYQFFGSGNKLILGFMASGKVIHNEDKFNFTAYQSHSYSGKKIGIIIYNNSIFADIPSAQFTIENQETTPTNRANYKTQVQVIKYINKNLKLDHLYRKDEPQSPGLFDFFFGSPIFYNRQIIAFFLGIKNEPDKWVLQSFKFQKAPVFEMMSSFRDVNNNLTFKGEVITTTSTTTTTTRAYWEAPTVKTLEGEGFDREPIEARLVNGNRKNELFGGLGFILAILYLLL